jgi:hypothetical protein
MKVTKDDLEILERVYLKGEWRSEIAKDYDIESRELKRREKEVIREWVRELIKGRG